MRFDVVTLFPELFAPFLTNGITRRAFGSGAVDVQLFNPRDVVNGNYRRVDDRPFGGGPGMVLMAEPLKNTLNLIVNKRGTSAPVVLFSPVGQRLDHLLVQDIASGDGAVLVCGRYEGVDQRFIDSHVDVQISIGDFVLSGGELPAMVLLDAVARLQPDVLSDADSHHYDSFNPALDGLLDCPHYTRPDVWEGKAVPQVLLSGHHVNIARWRRDQQLCFTARNRPDLIAKARAAGRLSPQDEAVLAAEYGLL